MSQKRQRRFYLCICLIIGGLVDGMLRLFSGDEGNLLVHTAVFLGSAALAMLIIKGVHLLRMRADDRGTEGTPVMKIRRSKEQDIERMMEIYAYARGQMAKTGNPYQWGPTNWPPEDLIRQDIEKGNSYVCENDAGRIIGTFYYAYGKDIEPTYRVITDGAWIDDSPYGVVHRVASDGSEKGTGTYCIDWAFGKCGHLRIDTHGDNKVMQNLLEKLGFIHCGTIYVEEDDYPRLAFEKTLKV